MTDQPTTGRTPARQCPQCGNWFFFSNEHCSVDHGEDCCHQYDTPASPMTTDRTEWYQEIDQALGILRNLPPSLNETDEQALALMEALTRAVSGLAKVIDDVAGPSCGHGNREALCLNCRSRA